MTELTPNTIATLFANCQAKEERLRTLVQLSKQLPLITPEQKIEANTVKGCESQVWLAVKYDAETEAYFFTGASDAKLIRGVLTILLVHVNGLTGEQIHALDLAGALQQLNLSSYLTSSRSNGISAIIERIKALTAS
ncbi:SufE family protein [Marinomonas agarivorans]|nr:SufE family protein [Marinomonas agarivorans]